MLFIDDHLTAAADQPLRDESARMRLLQCLRGDP
jgi:hypothetical protein